MRIRFAFALALLVLSHPAAGGRDADRALDKLRRDGHAFTVDAFLTQVFLGHTKVVKRFLQAGMSPDAADDGGVSAIHRAAHVYEPEVLALLLEADARVDPRAEVGDTPLCWAASRGHAEHVELLLEAGADVHAVCSFGATPLHNAVDASDVASARLLLAAGARVDARDRYGSTALIDAAGEPCPACVTLLLDAGAAVDARGRNGATALHEAVGSRSLDVVEVLLAAGADPTALNVGERSPIAEAEQRGLTDLVARLEAARGTVRPPAEAAPADAGDAFRQLRDLGITEIDDRALFARIDARDHAVVRLLLAAGVDPGARNRVGRTPLWEAVENDDLAMVEILIAAGADVEDPGRQLHRGIDYGKTLIMSAVDGAGPEVLAALLDAGADPDRHNIYGIGGLGSAARQGKTEHVRLLLDAGADVNTVDTAGTPVVYSAVKGGHVEILRQMLAAGADVRRDRDLLLDATADSDMKALLTAAAEAAAGRPPAPVRTPPPEPPTPTFPEPVDLEIGAEPVTGDQVYRMLLPIARAWQPDAELVDLGTTTEALIDEEGRSAHWVTHFYSRSAQKVNLISLREGTAIATTQASNELRMIGVDRTVVFDTRVLNRIADEAGGKAFRARGIRPQIGLTKNPRAGVVWYFNYRDPETRRVGLTVAIDARSGEVVFRDPS